MPEHIQFLISNKRSTLYFLMAFRIFSACVPQLQSTCDKSLCKIWQVSLKGADNIHPLSWLEEGDRKESFSSVKFIQVHHLNERWIHVCQGDQDHVFPQQKIRFFQFCLPRFKTQFFTSKTDKSTWKQKPCLRGNESRFMIFLLNCFVL